MLLMFARLPRKAGFFLFFIATIFLSFPAYGLDGQCISVVCFDGSVHACGFDCSALKSGSTGGGGVPQQPQGPSKEELERQRVESVHDWNDMGAEAYERGDYNSAVSYFQEALKYDPHNPSLIDNLAAAREKAIAPSGSTISVPAYLSSVSTALELVSVTPALLILHPSPYVREEAQRQLVEETLKAVANAAAEMVISENGRAQSLSGLSWDTEAEKAAKLAEAERVSREVEGLRLSAHEEARMKAGALGAPELSGAGNIDIVPGPAMSQLIDASISGLR